MTVGVIGLGIMGSAMAARLVRAGHRVAGYDIDRAARTAHARAGGEVAASAGEIAERARVIICSLPSSGALLETAAALVAAPRRPRVVVETSTLPIAIKEKARRRLAAGGVVLLDCPLSGTGAQARAGDLVVYASGDRAAWRTVVPIVRAFARAQYYLGPFGAGSKMKLVANLLVAIHNVAAAEALVLARQAGLDARLVLKAVGDGAGSSRMFELRGPMMVARRYRPPAMKLDVWQKDLAIIEAFARELGAPTPLFSACGAVYAAAMEMGFQRDDTAAVHAVLERWAGRRSGLAGR
jgi:putative dehydrogenase